MQTWFLCRKHAEWVYLNPIESRVFLMRDQCNGKMLLANGQSQAAIPYLGCAFEIAAILLDINDGKNVELRQTIASLAIMLCRLCSLHAALEQRDMIINRALALVYPERKTLYTNSLKEALQALSHQLEKQSALAA